MSKRQEIIELFEDGVAPAQIIEDGVASSGYVYRTIRSLKKDPDDTKKFNIRFINDDDDDDEPSSREIEIVVKVKVKVKVEVDDN